MSDNGVDFGNGVWVKKYWTGADDPWTPESLPDRVKDGILEVGWYADDIDDLGLGDLVGVYLHGTGVANGIYALGTVQSMGDATVGQAPRVALGDLQISTDAPLADDPWILAQVQPRRHRVVFASPEVSTTCVPGETCQKTGCLTCRFHRELPAIEDGQVKISPAGLDGYFPAYWVYARRSAAARTPDPNLQRASLLFYRFKYGETELAPLFATAIVEQLHQHRSDLQGLGERVVLEPVPLDPAKARDEAPHRTLELAKSIQRVSGAGWRVREDLGLRHEYGKRKLLSQGRSPAQIREALEDALTVSDGKVSPVPSCIVIVDDVATDGMTLEATAARLRTKFPKAEIIGVTAGQMTTLAAMGPGSPAGRADRGPRTPAAASARPASTSLPTDSGPARMGDEPEWLADMREHVLAYHGAGPWTDGARRSQERARRWTALQSIPHQ